MRRLLMRVSRAFTKLGWLVGHPEFQNDPARVIIRVLQWEFYRLRGTDIDLTLGEFTIRARPHDGIGRLVCYFGEAADEIFLFLPAYLKPGMTVVDVGANIGTHALYATSLVRPGGRVFAFEPDPSTLKQLRINLELNHAADVTVIDCCIMDKPGTILLNINADSAKTSVVREGYTQIEVKTDSLDNLIPTGVHIDLLKIDVEGADYDVLMGAPRIFSASPPGVVIIETTKRRRDIIEFLNRRRYGCYAFEPGISALRELRETDLNLYAVHQSLGLREVTPDHWTIDPVRPRPD